MQGFKGDPGVDGKNYDVQIGNTETLAPGSDATATTNKDEEHNVIYLNLGIPEGEKGEKGDTGDTNLTNFEIVNGKLIAQDTEGQTIVMGNVSIVPKGEYSGQITYNYLDLVTYNGNSYLALKTSTNVLPTDTEYWQYITGGLSQDDIVDNLESTSATKMLSAKQGKILQEKKIHSFNTVAEMKADNTLKDGMFAQTVGYSTANDGCAETYKIRTKTGSDVIDNDKIILLNDNTLVAEKIDKFFKSNNCLVKITKLENGSSYNFILSKSYDGINFEKVMVLNGVSMSGGHNSAMNFCYANNRFYLLTSLGYWFSEDLLNWSDMKTFNETISGPAIHNNKLYGHYKESNTQITNVIGGTTYPYSIKSFDITFNNDGTLTLSNGTTILQGDSTHSYIDPSVKEYKGITYFAFKDEINICIKLYKFNGGALEDTGFIHRGIGIEACKLIPTDTALYIYADPYNLRTNYSSTLNANYPRELSVRMTAIDNNTVNTDSLLTPVYGHYEYHPAYDVINDLRAVNIVNSLQYTPVLEVNAKKFRNVTLPSAENNAVVSVINHPLFLINIYGDTANKVAYLRFTKVFENTPAYISIDKSVKGIIHPAEGINDNTSSSTDLLLKQNGVFEAIVDDKTTGSFIYLPTEGKTSTNNLVDLPVNQSIFTSLNQYFTKNNTVNFFKIDGYNKDITVNLLPTSSNFCGTYYRQDDDNGIVMIYRRGNAIKEYRTTISGGTIAAWTTIQG